MNNWSYNNYSFQRHYRVKESHYQNVTYCLIPFIFSKWQAYRDGEQFSHYQWVGERSYKEIVKESFERWTNSCSRCWWWFRKINMWSTGTELHTYQMRISELVKCDKCYGLYQQQCSVILHYNYLRELSRESRISQDYSDNFQWVCNSFKTKSENTRECEGSHLLKTPTPFFLIQVNVQTCEGKDTNGWLETKGGIYRICSSVYLI
jgi:hypothetical protein